MVDALPFDEDSRHSVLSTLHDGIPYSVELGDRLAEIEDMIVKSSATLRITSDSMSASDITEILGAAPESSFERGDLVSARSAKPSYRKSAMWSWSGAIADIQPLGEHLMAICDFLEERKDKLPVLADCKIDVFCGVFSDNEQIGFDIDHQVIGLLADYPVDVNFDAYGNYGG
ncbi:MAG: DUF4279 domain-containing protein [Alphaproteobacteria bacterium]